MWTHARVENENSKLFPRVPSRGMYWKKQKVYYTRILSNPDSNFKNNHNINAHPNVKKSDSHFDLTGHFEVYQKCAFGQ